MNFKDIMDKAKRVMLCCGTEKRRYPLEISSPTNIKKGVLDMPDISREQLSLIREKAAADATRLIALSSHPPMGPPSDLGSQPGSLMSSREPSATLLNSASSNLPTNLPTPPRQQHLDSLPPSSAHSRMKGFWERTRRLSSLSTHSNSGYTGLRGDGKVDDEHVAMLDMTSKDIELDSPVSGKSTCELPLNPGGFEDQDVVGGYEQECGRKA